MLSYVFNHLTAFVTLSTVLEYKAKCKRKKRRSLIKQGFLTNPLTGLAWKRICDPTWLLHVFVLNPLSHCQYCKLTVFVSLRFLTIKLNNNRISQKTSWSRTFSKKLCPVSLHFNHHFSLLLPSLLLFLPSQSSFSYSLPMYWLLLFQLSLLSKLFWTRWLKNPAHDVYVESSRLEHHRRVIYLCLEYFGSVCLHLRLARQSYSTWMPSEARNVSQHFFFFSEKVPQQQQHERRDVREFSLFFSCSASDPVWSPTITLTLLDYIFNDNLNRGVTFFKFFLGGKRAWDRAWERNARNMRVVSTSVKRDHMCEKAGTLENVHVKRRTNWFWL